MSCVLFSPAWTQIPVVPIKTMFKSALGNQMGVEFRYKGRVYSVLAQNRLNDSNLKEK